MDEGSRVGRRNARAGDHLHREVAPVVARLERDALQAIAQAGGGRYSELTTGSTTSSPWASVDSAC